MKILTAAEMREVDRRTIEAGIPGIVLGPFVGAVIGQLASGSRVDHAARVDVGTCIGLLIGTAIKLAVTFMMLGSH